MGNFLVLSLSLPLIDFLIHTQRPCQWLHSKHLPTSYIGALRRRRPQKCLLCRLRLMWCHVRIASYLRSRSLPAAGGINGWFTVNSRGGIPSLTRTPFNKAKHTAGTLTNLRLQVLQTAAHHGMSSPSTQNKPWLPEKQKFPELKSSSLSLSLFFFFPTAFRSFAAKILSTWMILSKPRFTLYSQIEFKWT